MASQFIPTDLNWRLLSFPVISLITSAHEDTWGHWPDFADSFYFPFRIGNFMAK